MAARPRTSCASSTSCKDINDLVLDGVRRLRRAWQRRGNAGRKRKRGRPSKAASRRRASRSGPDAQGEGGVRPQAPLPDRQARGDLDEQQWEDLERMFGYLPELRTLWQFSQEVYKVWETEQSRKVARWRWTRLKNDPEYQEVPELAEALEGLEKGKMDEDAGVLGQPRGRAAEDEQPRGEDEPEAAFRREGALQVAADARASCASCCCGSAATSPSPRRTDNNRLPGGG